MPALEEEDVVKVDNYNSVTIQEYDGKFSLNAVQNGQNDNFYLKWAFPSEWKNGKQKAGDKAWPVRVMLGDRETAINVLSTVLIKLKGQASEIPDVPEDNIPF